jgi:hypothetical protein
MSVGSGDSREDMFQGQRKSKKGEQEFKVA